MYLQEAIAVVKKQSVKNIINNNKEKYRKIAYREYIKAFRYSKMESKPVDYKTFSSWPTHAEEFPDGSAIITFSLRDLNHYLEIEVSPSGGFLHSSLQG